MPIPLSPLRHAALLAILLVGTSAAAETPSWQAVGWGGGSFYFSSAFHPTKPGTIYLGGDCNGVYRSDDHGRHWRIINSGLVHYAIYALATDPAHPETVYAGTPDGTYRSVDGGGTWEFLPRSTAKDLGVTAARNTSVRALAVDRAGTLYAATPAGRLLRSRDAGATWDVLHALEDKGSFSAIAVAATAPEHLAAASASHGLLLSDDAGATWRAVPGIAHARSVAFAPTDPRILYAACGTEGIRRSADAGATWTDISAGLSGDEACLDLAVDATDPNRVAMIVTKGWGGATYRTSDGGAAWTRVSAMRRDLEADPTLPLENGGSPNADFSVVRSISASPVTAGELFVAGNWRNAWSADGGATWEERIHGADNTCTTDIRFLDGTTYVTAMDEGLMASPDQGATWKALAPLKWSKEGSGHHWRVDARKLPDGSSRLITTCSPWDDKVNVVHVGAPDGKPFALGRSGLPERRPTVNCMWGDGFARALAADPADPQVLWLGIDGDAQPDKGFAGGGVFRSGDGGRTWTQLPAQPGSRRMYYGLAVDPTDSRRLFWGACGEGGGLWRSEDAGASWQLVFKDETWIFNVHVTADGTVYCPGKELWKSGDHGTTWRKVTGFGTGLSIVGLESDPADSRVVWLSKVAWGSRADGAVWKTTDGGATWTDITGDIPYRQPQILRFDPVTRHLWAGGVGIYRIAQ